MVIAENLGGNEDGFAKLMTQKAHALGMSRTTYVNASGLPDDDQITTRARPGAARPRDPGSLSALLQIFLHRVLRLSRRGDPQSQPSARAVEGVDGIKTGFTRASGFNLVTSVHRDGRYIVAVVLGGRSAFERDAHMRELISAHIKEASLRRTAPVLAEQAAPRDEPQPVAFAKAPMASRAEPAHDRNGDRARCRRLERSDPAAPGADHLLPDRAGANGVACRRCRRSCLCAPARAASPVTASASSVAPRRPQPCCPTEVSPQPPCRSISPYIVAPHAVHRGRTSAEPIAVKVRQSVEAAVPGPKPIHRRRTGQAGRQAESPKPDAAKAEPALPSLPRFTRTAAG